jgi:hypothetical protein
MSRLLNALLSLIPRAETQRDVDDAYLAGAADIQDLECRMRTLDERGRNPSGGIAVGLYVR